MVSAVEAAFPCSIVDIQLISECFVLLYKLILGHKFVLQILMTYVFSTNVRQF